MSESVLNYSILILSILRRLNVVSQIMSQMSMMTQLGILVIDSL